MKLNKVINLQNKEAMTKTITFNELRRLKDSLPDGSTHRIADELGISVETVRNYFGGHNFKDGKSCGIHIEPGPDEPPASRPIWPASGKNISAKPCPTSREWNTGWRK